MMKWHGFLSLTSVGLITLGFVAVSVVTPRTVLAASGSQSEVIVIAQAKAVDDGQDADSGKAKKDTPLIKRGKRLPKPKEAGRTKGAPDPGIRAVRREAKIRLILEDQQRVKKNVVASRAALAGKNKQAAKIRQSDDDAGDAKKDTVLVKRQKREPKPKQVGREDIRDPKLRAKKRRIKLDILAKDRKRVRR